MKTNKLLLLTTLLKTLYINAFFFFKIRAVKRQRIVDKNGNILYFHSLKRNELKFIKKFSLETFNAELSLTKRLLLYLFGGKFCFVLKSSDEEIIGFRNYMIKYEEASKNIVHFGNLIVRPQFRGSGYGKLLVELSTKEISHSPFIRGVTSDVRVDNRPSLSVLSACGYAIKYTHLNKSTKKEMVYLQKDF